MGSVTRRSPAGRIARLLLEAAAVVVGVVHLLFGPANFQRGYPKGEGITAILAGVAILGGVAVGRLRSTRTGLLVALLGTLPLVAWFVYDRGESSDRQFLLMSLVVPSVSAGLLVVGRLRAQVRPTG